MMRALAAAGVLLAGAIPTTAQARFPLKVEVVRVDVLATDRGKPLLGLRATDFEVRDNGVLQRVDFASFEDVPLSVVLVLDMSSSVGGERLQDLRRAAQAVLLALERNDRCALVTFGDAVFVRSVLTADVQRIREALEAATPGGYTAMIDATQAGLLLSESDLGRQLMVVFSDGVDTASWLSADAVLKTAQRCDAVVYAVTPRRRHRSGFLKDLTDTTGGDLLQIDSTRDLGGAFAKILQEFRSRYLVSYAPRGVPQDGWHKLQVRIKGRSASVKARMGYLAGGAGRPSDQGAVDRGPGQRAQAVVHGTADERDGRGPDRAGAAAGERAAAVGVDVPLLVAPPPGPRRRLARSAHAHRGGDGAEVLRRSRGAGG